MMYQEAYLMVMELYLEEIVKEKFERLLETCILFLLGAAAAYLFFSTAYLGLLRVIAPSFNRNDFDVFNVEVFLWELIVFFDVFAMVLLAVRLGAVFVYKGQ
jgi:hypothetical protein